jgi:hypothetical protein
MRCLPAPAKPAYWPKGIYCHAPDNRILRLAPNGSPPTTIATLPAGANSDGALAFDTVGRFGYALLAATGGSGTGPGQVFAIRKSGKVDTIGSYAGPGGAENAVVAPARFGSASGRLLLTIDDNDLNGRVLAIDRKGSVQVLAAGLMSGLNPISVIAPSPAKRASGLPAAGLYLSETTVQNVYFVSAASLADYVGDVFVGAESSSGDQFWILRPVASGGFELVPVSGDLPQRSYNFEASDYVP